MSAPYTGSYEEDTQTLFFDQSVEPTFLERNVDYDKDHSNKAVTIRVPLGDEPPTIPDLLNGLGIGDLEDNYLYSLYSVDANVPEDLQVV